MNDLHYIQMHILKELLFNPGSRFSQLNKNDLPNDHFNYHLKKLISLNYITKNKSTYILTNQGKLFANKMDTEKLATERQAKISALVVV